MQFKDIPQFPHSSYEVDISWEYLESQLKTFGEMGLDLDPDFQRGYVWTYEQKVAFVEYSLRGGGSARNIYFNCFPDDWRRARGPIQLIDGKQRLEAVRQFLRDGVEVFDGSVCSEMGKFRLGIMLRFHVQTMPTRADVLRWYIGMNSGGSVHSREEIERVKELLRKELEKNG